MLRVKKLGIAWMVAVLAVGAANLPRLSAAQAPNTQTSVRSSPQKSAGKPLADIQTYISRSWSRLTRSMTSCKTLRDVKSTSKPVLYLPARFAEPESVEKLEKDCGVSVRHLPAAIKRPGAIGVKSIRPQGLLYLPNPYVVPGGRFNEMYGWDSYFIIRGLVRAGKWRLARGIVENFFFEIQHYGMVLNANRTYYLTRSQPPFLTSMVMAVYNAEKAAGHEDRAWLKKAYPFAVRNYELWTRAPHLADATGLSRYFALGQGPAPEVTDGNPSYYRLVAAYFLQHPLSADGYLVPAPSNRPSPTAIGPVFSIYVCQGKENPEPKGCTIAKRVCLTASYYKGDRSMRESGFDVSFRFGPFGAATPDYAPVGLNSLLYKSEKDLEQMSRLLGRRRQAREWTMRAAARREKVNKYLWDPKRGLYFDYNFRKQQRSSYLFATTFYPLWAGLSSPEQAKAVADNLARFLDLGGLVTSLRKTGAQWDYPYGWAPLQLIAAEGMWRYHFDHDADQLAYRFLATVLRNFQREGTIREKYDVVTGSSETNVKVGYKQNVIGFGWTNGVFSALLHRLPEAWRQRLASN